MGYDDGRRKIGGLQVNSALQPRGQTSTYENSFRNGTHFQYLPTPALATDNNAVQCSKNVGLLIITALMLPTCVLCSALRL
jgi:hypothetical protein